MGCDIHCYVERREKNGEWTSAEKWSKRQRISAPYLENRNYDLFAILASVRNGHGFAGVKTGSGFVPISPPRGLPADTSPQVRAEGERWEGGGHSHSHLTVAEIMAYDWTQTSVKTGIVGLRQLGRWKILGAPESWSGDISGPGIEIHDAEVAVPIVDHVLASVGADDPRASWYSIFHAEEDDYPTDRLSAPGEDSTVVQVRAALSAKLNCARPRFRVSWTVPYYRAGRELLSEVLPRLWRLGAPGDARLVFWFDN